MGLASNFVKNLRRQRGRQLMSQKVLARVVGCDPTYISHLEHGRREPSLSTIEAMADALLVHPLSLLSPPTDSEVQPSPANPSD